MTHEASKVKLVICNTHAFNIFCYLHKCPWCQWYSLDSPFGRSSLCVIMCIHITSVSFVCVVFNQCAAHSGPESSASKCIPSIIYNCFSEVWKLVPPMHLCFGKLSISSVISTPSKTQVQPLNSELADPKGLGTGELSPYFTLNSFNMHAILPLQLLTMILHQSLDGVSN